MNVRACKGCKKLFNYIMGQSYCPACRERLEEKFQEVKKYIQDNRHATIPQVSEACDVTTNQIQQWLREERLQLGEGSGITLFCENCNAAIVTGRFCEKCKNSMADKLNSSIHKPEAPKPQSKKKDPKDNPKMRFLG